MHTISESTPVDGYFRLIERIILSGIREHDTSFLQSAWCKYLMDMLMDYKAHSKAQTEADTLEKMLEHGREV